MSLRYFVHCAFAGSTDIADPAFLLALEAAGILRILEADPLAFALVAPSTVSASASGHWASMTADKLQALRDDWTVTVDREQTEAN